MISLPTQPPQVHRHRGLVAGVETLTLDALVAALTHPSCDDDVGYILEEITRKGQSFDEAIQKAGATQHGVALVSMHMLSCLYYNISCRNTMRADK